MTQKPLRRVAGTSAHTTLLREGCDHNYPIVAKAAEQGKPRRAQCLGCGKLGPPRQDFKSARQALLASRHESS